MEITTAAAETNLALALVLSVGTDLNLTSFSLTKDHIGPTGWVEKANLIPALSHDNPMKGVAFAHLGFFEVDFTRDGKTTFDTIGHFIPFGRRDLDDARVAVVSDNGGCMGGYQNARTIAAFAKARKTGQLVVMDESTETESYTVEIRPLASNIGSREDDMQQLVDDLDEFFQNNAEVAAEPAGMLHAIDVTPRRLRRDVTPDRQDTLLDTMVDALSVVKAELETVQKDMPDSKNLQTLLRDVTFHLRVYTESRDQGRYWLDQAEAA